MWTKLKWEMAFVNCVSMIESLKSRGLAGKWPESVWLELWGPDGWEGKDKANGWKWSGQRGRTKVQNRKTISEDLEVVKINKLESGTGNGYRQRTAGQKRGWESWETLPGEWGQEALVRSPGRILLAKMIQPQHTFIHVCPSVRHC